MIHRAMELSILFVCIAPFSLLHRRRLLDLAATCTGDRGARLLLVVDGLGEDEGASTPTVDRDLAAQGGQEAGVEEGGHR
jgi:hypothetical protein